MRLWSIHPKNLDCRGLVALWREALLARAVLRGETRGYRNHPQLERFKAHAKPLDAIEFYLSAVLREGASRGYAFDAAKVSPAIRDGSPPFKITVTDGQLRYELSHLDAKLRSRAPANARENRLAGAAETHPIFRAIKGGIEPWEKTPSKNPGREK